MFDAKAAIISIVLICAVSGGTAFTARAEDTAHRDFADHFFQACMPFVLKGRSPDGYIRDAVSREVVDSTIVQTRKLEPADPDLARDLLHGQTGRVFVQEDQFTPMTLILSNSGACTVAARDMPDMDELVVATERRLAAFSPRFGQKNKNELHITDGSTLTRREYTAEVDGHAFLVIFSTAPTAGDQVGRATVMIAKTADK